MLKKMRSKANLWFLVVMMMVSLFFSLPVLAQEEENLNLRDGLDDFLTGSEMGGKPIGFVIGRIVQGVLGILGLVCLVIFVIAGFQWMTSAGSKEKIQSAQKSMSAAVIGLIIVIISWAAIDFIVGALESVTG
ncbi:pilin [Patescibacteria group bacterium]|nr:pilin [Patescibacteria group bacterium]